MRGDIYHHTDHGHEHWLTLQHTEYLPTVVCAAIVPPGSTNANSFHVPLLSTSAHAHPEGMPGVVHLTDPILAPRHIDDRLRYPIILLDQIHTITPKKLPAAHVPPYSMRALDHPLTTFLGLLT